MRLREWLGEVPQVRRLPGLLFLVADFTSRALGLL